MAGEAGKIYIGVGGWNVAPLRGVVYPDQLTHADDIAYAAANPATNAQHGTFYGSQHPRVLRKVTRAVPRALAC